jgi:hypothetical protein
MLTEALTNRVNRRISQTTSKEFVMNANAKPAAPVHPVETTSPFAGLSDDTLAKLLTKSPVQVLDIRRVSDDHWRIVVHGDLPIAVPANVNDAIAAWQRDRWMSRLLNGLGTAVAWTMRLGLAVVGATALYAAVNHLSEWAAAAKLLGH